MNDVNLTPLQGLKKLYSNLAYDNMYWRINVCDKFPKGNKSTPGCMPTDIDIF